MTTHVTVSVNGRYRATIKQDDKEPVVIEGGDTAPGQHTFYLGHPATGTFEISEEYIGDQVETTVRMQGVSEAIDEVKSFAAGAQSN